MAWKRKTPAGNRGLSKIVRLGGTTRSLINESFVEFCQGVIHGLTIPFTLAYHQFLYLIICLAIVLDVRWRWIHRLADRQIIFRAGGRHE